jgi:hypothetical protein
MRPVGWGMKSLVACVVLGLAVVSGCATARPAEDHAMRNGYVYLGERWVRGTGQPVHEAIGGLRRDGRFASVMLVIEHAPVQMDDLAITFGNGEVWRPGARLVFGPDSTTREIALPGGVRHIRRVDFVFNNFPGDGHAKVELWAR